MLMYCIHLYNCGNAFSSVSLYDLQLKEDFKKYVLVIFIYITGAFSYLRFVISFIQAGISLSLLLLRTRVLRLFMLQMVSGKEFISFLWSHKVWRFSILKNRFCAINQDAWN